MSEKRSIFSRVILFAGMFGIPAFFILIFLTGKQNFADLLYYGDHKVVNGDTVSYYKVPAFTFYNHKGEKVTEKDFEDKIMVVNYVYKNCPLTEKCPLDFLNFKRFIIDEIYTNDGFSDVKVLSLFVGEKDTLVELNQFIKDHNVNTDRWMLVTGDMSQIYNTDMKTQNPWDAKDSIFGYPRVANVLTLLIDKNKHIRGKYITTYTPEVKRITKEISILKREEKETKE